MALALKQDDTSGKKALSAFTKWALQDADMSLSDAELAELEVLQKLPAADATVRTTVSIADNAYSTGTTGRFGLNFMDTWMDRRSPQWLMGWRRNARSNDEKTTIAAVILRTAQWDSVFLWSLSKISKAPTNAALIANLDSLPFDYVARQKVGGVNFRFYFMKQLPVLPPEQRRTPYNWHPERRAQLRAELDAYYALLYGLTRDELRHILDPADAPFGPGGALLGPDYPSETFRGLKNKEEKAFGEYRTRRLVLAAWNEQETRT